MLVPLSQLLAPTLRNTEEGADAATIVDAAVQDSREAVCRGAGSDAAPSFSVMQATRPGQRLSGWGANSFPNEETA